MFDYPTVEFLVHMNVIFYVTVIFMLLNEKLNYYMFVAEFEPFYNLSLQLVNFSFVIIIT